MVNLQNSILHLLYLPNATRARNGILGGPDAYLDRIITAGFDGVYLDIIDAFEYFEEKAFLV
ncbi:MAG: hypothetical protein NTZ09_01885 [Candidatus Hydrogenedentes bacterium]|nr:hypothetical protein [Candidatus Hydrogenedentota bacterium]